jgi:hypothetical protein
MNISLPLPLQQQEAWRVSAREKIDTGWEEAKSGQLLSIEQTGEELGRRKADWKRQHGH